MKWDGTERRSSMGFCQQHIETVKVLTEVSTSLKGLMQQMTDTNNFRKSIIIILISMSITIVVHASLTGFFIGQMSKQITVNTSRLDIIEQTAVFA